MKLKKVWLMCGIPGSGKSTWAKKRLMENGGIWISRDEVRFSMVKEDEDYFSKECEVFDKFISNICEALKSPLAEDIYIDATHLSDKARKKVLNRLPKDNIDEVIYVVFKVPYEVCVERNNKREGRERVPESAIRRMYLSFQYPDIEKYHVIFINERGEIV